MDRERHSSDRVGKLDEGTSPSRRIDLRQLRQFVVLSEELHFGRAAKRLGIAQPPLSQTIKRLETEIGVELFNRSNRRVELSTPGRAFLAEVKIALETIEFASRLARRVEAGEFSKLNVGFVSSALFQTLPEIMRSFRSVSPDASLRLIEASSQHQIENLRDGSLDIGFLHASQSALTGLETLLVERSKTIAAIPAALPESKLKRVRLADLADLPFILLPYDDSPTHYMNIISACQTAGFTPKVSQEAAQTQTMLQLVSAGFGIALIVETAAKTQLQGVSFVPVDDLPDTLCVEMKAAWNPLFSSVARDKLIKLLSNRQKT